MKKNYQKNTMSARTPVLPEAVSIAMAELAGDVQEGLLAMAVGTGLQVMAAMMNADVEAVCGPRGKHDPARTAVRHGSEDGSVTLGGRRVPVTRPRMRATDGSGELPVESYELFSRTEVLCRMAMARMLAGLSTRRYPVGLEPVGQRVEESARSTSKSAVSRRFVAATETALGELLAADLSGLDLVALMIDGVHFADHLCVVALGIGIDGTKHPLGLGEGSTENTSVVTDLLTGLRERGLDTTRPIFVGIDGGKALRAAVVRVFDHPVIQRCQLHKLRNVADKLPDHLASTVTKRMRAAYRAESAILAEAQLEALAKELQRTHPRRGRVPARGPDRGPHRPAPRRFADAGPHAALDQLHRVDDLDRAQPLHEREELAEQHNGAALVRRRPDRSPRPVPPRQRPPAPARTPPRARRARRHANCQCRAS